MNRNANTEWMAGFLDEATSHVDALEEGLLSLERAGVDGWIRRRTPAEQDRLHGMFRAAHSLKGLAGMLGLGSLRELTHRFESLLDRLRGGAALPVAMAGELLQVADALRQLVRSAVAAEPRTPALAGPLACLERAIGALAPAEPCAADSATAGAAARTFTIRVCFAPGVADAVITACILYSRLAGLSSRLTASPDVMALTGNEQLSEVIYTAVSTTAPSALEAIIRNYGVADVSVSETQPVSEISPAAASQKPAIPMATAAVPHWSGDGVTAETQSCAEAAVAVSAANGRAGPDTIRVDRARLDALLDLGGELISMRSRFSVIGRQLESALRGHGGRVWIEQVEECIRRLQAYSESPADAAGNWNSVPGREACALLLRVSQYLRQADGARSALRDLADATHAFGRISDDMQRTIMQARMTPIGPLLQRMQRVLRDASAATGKSVELVLRGEQTELDKRLIDGLGDPLTHLVRNAVDHGIEAAAARQASGKPARGRIEIAAIQSGRHALLEVCDDGGGFDLVRIRELVVRRGLASEQEARDLSDDALRRFAFRPGFSTLSQATPISGRGVGMDVVHSAIEALGGSVEISSERGRGTRVTLRLPLTLATLPAMLARVGADAFALPLDSVCEVVTAGADRVRQVCGRSVMALRGRIVPLMRIDELCRRSANDPGGSSSARTGGEPGDHPQAAVIVTASACRIGLLVDELIGREEIVVKDIAANFRGVPGVAGASILGDGSIALILDPAALCARIGRPAGD